MEHAHFIVGRAYIIKIPNNFGGLRLRFKYIFQTLLPVTRQGNNLLCLRLGHDTDTSLIQSLVEKKIARLDNGAFYCTIWPRKETISASELYS